MRSKLLFLIVLIVTVAALPGTVGANQVPNPGFDDQNSDNNPWVEDLNPDQWTSWASAGSRAWKQTGGVGGACLNLTATGSGGMYAWPDEEGTPADIPIDTAKDYYFALKAKGGTSLTFKIEWHVTDGETGEGGLTPVIQSFTTGADWEQFEMGPLTPDPAAGFVRFAIINESSGTTVTIDNVFVDTHPPGLASNPSPADNSKVQAPGTVDLKWENQTAQTCNVYWDDGSADVNDLNFQWHIDTASVEVTNIGTIASSDPNEILGKAVVADRLYHWRVDVGSLAGIVWNFSTTNDPPEVDAGLKQARWLPSGDGSVSFQLAPTVSDDGLPIPPGAITYLWTATDPCNPGVVTFTPGGATSTDPDPNATMGVAGDYIIDLTVSDGTLIDTDTVKLRVHANGTTGLEARYDCEELNTALGIHDDYSGAEKNPIGTYPNFDYSNGTRRGERMDDIGDFNTDAQGTNNTTMDTTGGHTGGGIIIDGGTGHVKIANSWADPNWQLPIWADFEDEVTLAAWIKVDPDNGGFDDNWESIIVKGYPGAYRLERNAGTDGVQFSVDYDNTDDGIANVDGTYAAWGGMNVNDGEWHHVVGTYDGAEVCIYVDGIEDDCQETGGAQIALNDGPVTVGLNYQTDDPQAFGGTLDEIRIHSIGLPHASDKPEAALTALTARSVLSIYRTSGGHISCADETGEGYYAGDVNEDCYVDLKDIKAIAGIWLDCNDIGNASCIP